MAIDSWNVSRSLYVRLEILTGYSNNLYKLPLPSIPYVFNQHRTEDFFTGGGNQVGFMSVGWGFDK